MSDTTVPSSSVMSDDDVLAFTQGLRRNVLSTLTEKIIKTPTEVDKSDKTLFAALVDGLDRQAMGNKRIKVEEQANQDMAGTAALIAEMLAKLPNRIVGANEIIEDARIVELQETDAPPPMLLPGETEVAAAQLDYNSFQASIPAP